MRSQGLAVQTLAKSIRASNNKRFVLGFVRAAHREFLAYLRKHNVLSRKYAKISRFNPLHS